jgi:hypothetical protein
VALIWCRIYVVQHERELLGGGARFEHRKQREAD